MTETVTVLKKEPTCAELVDEQWRESQEDLKDPEYEALGFDYVAPHTWDDQPEGYWRWQFSWGGPSDELRGYNTQTHPCLLYTSPSPRDGLLSRMPSSA